VSEEAEPAEPRLVAAAQAGDRRAFDSLVLLYKAPLYRFVRRYVGDPDDAYDLLQSVFISAWLALQRYDPRHPFAVWLRAIALNKCRDYGRRRAVHRRFLTLFAAQGVLSHDPAGSSQADTELGQAQRLRLLDQAIAALPRLYKEPLLLMLVNGLTQEQVAQELKTTLKAIEMRVRRAKKRLRQALGEVISEDGRREG
jgi:RNA polymerase sigma-70 factor (ECF subfamily)